MNKRIKLEITDDGLRQAISTCAKLSGWELAEFDPDYLTSVFECLLESRAELEIANEELQTTRAELDLLHKERWRSALLTANEKIVKYENALREIMDRTVTLGYEDPSNELWYIANEALK